MDFNFRKFFFWVAAILGALILLYQYYTPQAVLDFTKHHPDYEWSPRIEYYVGLSAYLRDQSEDAEKAFTQLLMDYPTCYYAPNATYRLGNIFAEKNRFAEAREMYQKYMDNYPEGERLEIVRKKFEYIKFR